MNSIIISKGGIHAREYDENTNLSSLSKVDGPICLHFQSTVEVEKGVTVEDFVRILIEHEADIDIMFYGFSKGHRLRPFYEEMLMEPFNKRTDVSYAEIGWAADYFGAENKSQRNELFMFLQINGVVAKKKGQEATSHALSQAPLNDWKHLPLIVSDRLMVHDFKFSKHADSGRQETNVIMLLDAKKDITLYELIGGFLDSITWYGYPEQRKERMDDIEEIVSGGLEDIGVSTLEDKEYELEKAIEREDYERAGVLKKEIDNIKKTLDNS